MSSSARPPTIGYHPSISITGGESTGHWLYNDQARVVTHAAHSCNICSQWVYHYVSSVAINDNTLREAVEKRDDVIRASLATEAASLRRTNDSLRHELDAVRNDLEATRRRLDNAEDKIRYLRGRPGRSNTALIAQPPSATGGTR